MIEQYLWRVPYLYEGIEHQKFVAGSDTDYATTAAFGKDFELIRKSGIDFNYMNFEQILVVKGNEADYRVRLEPTETTGLKRIFNKQIIHIGTHETTVSILRCTNNRLSANIK